MELKHLSTLIRRIYIKILLVVVSESNKEPLEKIIRN